jgi:hypothetical protein
MGFSIGKWVEDGLQLSGGGGAEARCFDDAVWCAAGEIRMAMKA